MRIRLNDGWQFSLGEADNLQPVAIPHDWLIGDPQKWYQSGVGWYQRTLDAGFVKPGQKVYLHFDGVYMNSTLTVNGHKAGEWKNGFTAFSHEITEYLKPDKDNILLLKVDARFPSVRWYSGAGIYRDVSLIVKNACHFSENGIYITTYQDEDGLWQYEVTTEIEGYDENCLVTHELLETDERLPWSPENPKLYTLRSRLYQNGQIMDIADTRFGFRSLRFDANEGFFINGRRLKLNGVCLHQEFAIIGSAVQRDFIIRQFKALKRMGVNAVRTAHNAPSRVFMELCDEMGMLVISEFTDVWQIGKTANDYARYFDAWHERDVESWIRRDRNSPSVIMWSLGNEIPDTNADLEKGTALLHRLQDLVKSHDPKGQAVPTLGSNYMAWENTQQAVQGLPAVGYNYAEFLYQKHHEHYPDWVIYGSETCSTVQSRGIYHFPLSQPTLAEDDLQVSSLGNSTTGWGALSVDKCIKDDRDTPFSLGQFVWSGQDYLGEPTPYQTKNSYFGMLDTAGFEKDAYSLFQSAWTSPNTAPMVHLFPYWDFSDGQIIDVRVSTNQHKVRLYLNDELLGEQAMDGDITVNWQVPYKPGTLRAEAYNEAGVLIATAERTSFGEAEQLHLSFGEMDELTFVTITAQDKDGKPVENANALVDVSVTDGELLGLDNGDASDYTPYQHPSRRLFSGKLLAVVKKQAGREPKVSAVINEAYKPVRKIALSREGDVVKAACYPKDAAKQDLFWRVTNAAGVDSALAEFTVLGEGDSIQIKPLSDGDIFVRCGVKNDKPHLDLYAQVNYTQSGIGSAHLNPYEVISASLYSKSNVPLENGAERGIATPRNARSQIYYDNLDFGKKGSDTLSVRIFVMDNDPFTMEVWAGHPDEGGRLLARPRYELGSEWMVYKDFHIKLDEKITGKTGICLVFDRKVHIRDFSFANTTDASQWIKAGDADELYGDHFKRKGDSITEIGNNTSIGYQELYLNEPGTAKLEIHYESAQANNPVQLQIHGENGEQRSMLNLSGQTEGGKRVFELSDAVHGKFSLRMIFLPGCQVDLHGFRFLPTVQ